MKLKQTKINVIFDSDDRMELEVGGYYEFNGLLYQLTDKVMNGMTGNVVSLYLKKVSRFGK